MSNGEEHHRLPGRVEAYLGMLCRLYEQKGEALLRQLVVNGQVTVQEEWDYDNWDGGIYGHAITLTVPADIFFRVMDQKHDLETRIATDLNAIDNTQNEHVSEVFIETEPQEIDRWREDSGVYRMPMAPLSVSADALRRIWGAHHVRVFLSHKSPIKVETTKLKEAFLRCGLAAFVAHEDIKPTEEWQREIERALFSMDALVALLTVDFHESNWTDQEVGVAIGRGVPIIAVRLGQDPYGLMGKAQGLGGCDLAHPNEIASKVFDLLYGRLPDKSRLFECAVSAYALSTSWEDSGWRVENLLSVFETLTPEQVARVLDAYRNSDENKFSFKGKGHLQPLLEKWTRERWHVQDNELVPVSNLPEEETGVPF